MATTTSRASSFSDLIQRVTASCLLHPLAAGRHHVDEMSDLESQDDDNKCKTTTDGDGDEEEDDESEDEKPSSELTAIHEIEALMSQVFDSVSAMKRAYVSLQEAHSPWDPDKIRVSDVAVVTELRKLGILRERFRRRTSGGGKECGSGGGVRAATLREMVAPYEAAVQELKSEVKAKEIEIDNLKVKLQTATAAAAVNVNGGGRKGRSHHQSRKKVSSQALVVAAATVAPSPELFTTTVSMVNESSKSFTTHLLSLMRSANWDITAAVRSIEAAATSNTTGSSHYAKHALEAYVNRKMFQGFDHETFYMDGSLSSLLQPDQFRRDCFTQYCDMKAMDPVELLGILPSCQFGKFCSKKYLSIVHPKMEESLFGDLEQRRQLLAGTHPRSQFYGEYFLALAKVIWLLHLLAFSLDPPPSQFEASAGAEFHPEYMESVTGCGDEGLGLVVGLALSPGFKFGNGSVIKARVYLVPRTM